ncbi:MAG: MFS transporter [Ardenticatenaceae bacterium]|nr:MFS transporter [Ardenticatenaceae bacterium]
MTRNNKLVLVSLLLWGIGEGLFVFIESLYLERLGATPVEVGMTLALASAAVLVSYLPAGWLSDRFNRKANMLAGYVVGALAAFVMALAHDWHTLLLGLVFYAVSGFCVPAITSYVVQEAAPRERNRVVTTVFVGYSAGLVISPAIGGWLAEHWTMRGVFVVSGAAFLLATATVSLAAPQPRPPVAATMPAAWRALWGQPRVPRLAAVLMVFFIAAYMGFPLAPNFLARAGYDLAILGALGSVHAAGAVLWGVILGRLDERGTRGLLVGGAVLVLYAGLLVVVPPLPVIVMAFVLRGALISVRSVAAARLAVEVDDQSLGLTFGLLSSLQAGGMMIAAWLAGLLFARNPAFPLLATIIFLPPILLLLWRDERRAALARGPLAPEPAESL